MANLQKSNCLHRYTEIALLRSFLEKISLFSVVYNKFQLKHQMRKGLGTYLTITRWTKFNCSTERLIEKSKAPIIHAYNCAKSAYIIRITLVRRYCQVRGVLRWDTSLAKSRYENVCARLPPVNGVLFDGYRFNWSTQSARVINLYLWFRSSSEINLTGQRWLSWRTVKDKHSLNGFVAQLDSLIVANVFTPDDWRTAVWLIRSSYICQSMLKKLKCFFDENQKWNPRALSCVLYRRPVRFVINGITCCVLLLFAWTTGLCYKIEWPMVWWQT